jgi:integrase
MKATTILKTFGNLSGLFEWGKEGGYCDGNPFGLYNSSIRKRPGASPETPTPHTIEEFSKLLLTAWLMDKLIFMAILLASFCGLRRKELLRITYGDLYLKFGTVKVRKAITKEKKNKKSRPVKVATSFILFWKLIPVMDSALRIIPLTEVEYTVRLKAVRDAAGIEEWGKDRMRKNYSILQQWLLAPLATRKIWLGHEEDSGTTEDFYDGDADPEWANNFEKLPPADVLGQDVQPCKPEDLV